MSDVGGTGEDDPARLARAVRLARYDRGWSQTQLARESRIGRSVIIEIESGRPRDRSADLLARLDTAFGVNCGTSYRILIGMVENFDDTTLLTLRDTLPGIRRNRHESLVDFARWLASAPPADHAVGPS